jgi:hypothetical protein
VIYLFISSLAVCRCRLQFYDVVKPTSYRAHAVCCRRILCPFAAAQTTGNQENRRSMSSGPLSRRPHFQNSWLVIFPVRLHLANDPRRWLHFKKPSLARWIATVPITSDCTARKFAGSIRFEVSAAALGAGAVGCFAAACQVTGRRSFIWWQSRHALFPPCH